MGLADAVVEDVTIWEVSDKFAEPHYGEGNYCLLKDLADGNVDVGEEGYRTPTGKYQLVAKKEGVA